MMPGPITYKTRKEYVAHWGEFNCKRMEREFPERCPWLSIKPAPRHQYTTPFEAWLKKRWESNWEVDSIPDALSINPRDFMLCPEPWRTIFIVSLGFCGEGGEVVEHIKKLVRDGKFDREEFAKELGDRYHYLVKLAHMFGFSMDDIERINVRKLEARDTERQLENRG